MIVKKSSYSLFYLLCLFTLFAFSGCAGTPAPADSTGTGGASDRPSWIRSPYSVFNERQYVAAVGYGNDAVQAEKSAFANLTAIFGQSIRVNETLNSSYQEMVRSGGAARWTESTSLESVIQTSTSLDALFGSEIRERYNERGTWYAAAVMERAKAVRMYTDVINANLTMINNLTDMNESEKNSLEGYSRYQFAATVADINVSYGNVLKYLGAAIPAGFRDGSTYRIEAANITRAIPVAVVVSNDRNNRVQAAIAKSLADLGFRSGGNNSRYLVEAALTFEEEVFPDSPYKHTRCTITANFIDSNGNVVLIPYSYNRREAHNSMPNAETRALTTVVNQIGTEYTNLLKDYISRLLPQK
jgi:hypothetical protein